MLSRAECARLMGFPSGWVPEQVSRTQAFKQFGNSVVVPVVDWIGRSLVDQGILPIPARSPVEADRQVPLPQVG
jgi:hypothetical protein